MDWKRLWGWLAIVDNAVPFVRVPVGYGTDWMIAKGFGMWAIRFLRTA